MSHSMIIQNVVKKFGDYRAVNQANFTVEKGEFFTLLGPSGCGKTTLLRMIAGFNSIEEGEIIFNDKVINDIPAHKRDIGMVFQNYAIFPHLSVYKNVAYGLKARNVAAKEMKERVEEALRMVQMEEYKDRQPSHLSGGQQQRIALARAVVIHPKILLMDEPLSNLDAKLRVQMRITIRKLQKQLGITTVYVTHDQEEALAISDRIAIMKEGVIQQIGESEKIYKRPANGFVANFIGTSNFLEGKVTKINEEGLADILVLNKSTIKVKLKKQYEDKVVISIRPEEFVISEPVEGQLRGEVTLSTFLGDFINYEIKLENGQVIEVNEYTKDVNFSRKIGDKVSITTKADKINIFDHTGEESLVNE
ncbi:ABC transporter ATP-binding protein [Alkaliphilus peptidifermentans]|uniref:Spermidine/putrescine import ATP-binding protein PotA n=1 Tax=Alkaliphilus peptidifermentans DSM 18978 TaxID=1120976 RepID=A0A1G5AVC8_9FIRM|nr:ABC transporter ATP-binding protein [Alkaliphilus peptidifermentans]SCX81801.1 iron(III) transport system ATP-binding protein [Alkaliphilus peptidifermentans DSM 18978]